MKKLLRCILMLIPLLAKSQDNLPVMVAKKIVDGKVCDSCLVTRAGNLNLMGDAKQVSFLTPNNENQFLYIDSSLTKNSTTVPVSSYFLAVPDFSLDFYSFAQQQLIQAPAKTEIPPDLVNMQFRTAINGHFHNDWTDIISLPADPNFYLGNAQLGDLPEHGDQPETTPLQNFHAGKFTLALGESLRVFVRNKLPGGQSYEFSIRRVKSVPDQFEFFEFSSASSFEDILNNEVNKRRDNRVHFSDSLEMEAGNSALIRFNADFQYQFFGRTQRNSGIEYAIGDRSNAWRDLGGQNMKFVNEYSYIYLHNPKAGEILNVFLRYKHQPESVHTVTIRVKDAPGMAKWIYWAFSIVALGMLFGLGYLVQKRRYRLQLNNLNRKKLEVENQLQLLSGQLNPHFLFNSLNAVQGLIRQNDPETASAYIHEVATFLRTIMDSSKKEFVSLKEELLIEERYLALEIKRRAFSYSIQNECYQDPSGIDFPPLLLQPIIENSIRHGFADLTPNPQLIIKIKCDKNDLVLSISDNGIGFDPKVNDGGHGLSITRRRIALLNEQLADMPITLSITSSPGNGSQTEIRLSKWLN
ncbi:MAG: histidine kinase [Dyadobacter sp.]|uniref:sensor histidine kinase n=1 Tax=Dyadobacter sp. TaxID=1914288 RepID=UPI003264C8FE